MIQPSGFYAIISQVKEESGFTSKFSIDNLSFDFLPASGELQSLRDSDPTGIYSLVRIPINLDDLISEISIQETVTIINNPPAEISTSGFVTKVDLISTSGQLQQSIDTIELTPGPQGPAGAPGSSSGLWSWTTSFGSHNKTYYEKKSKHWFMVTTFDFPGLGSLSVNPENFIVTGYIQKDNNHGHVRIYDHDNGAVISSVEINSDDSNSYYAPLSNLPQLATRFEIHIKSSKKKIRLESIELR